MDERVKKWLYDIRQAIEEIEGFNSQEQSFDEFTQNIVVKRAVERDLEIIGEAMNRILTRDPDIAIENARRIVGLRNQIIHGYDNISEENIWAVLINHLPKLKQDVDRLLG